MSLRVLLVRLFSRRHRRSDADLDDEFSAHIEMAAAELRARGMSEEAAGREARLRFGGVTQQREAYLQQSRPPWIDSIGADLRYAVRQLRRNPGFATVAILTLALGVGLNSAMFRFLDAVILRTLPVEKPEQLFFPEITTPEGANSQLGQCLKAARQARGLTLKQVAASAGVSYQTVWRALHNSAGILPDTRTQVLEVAERLGYRRNSLASGLRRSPTIA